MKIQAERLFLRNYEVEDFAAVHEYGADPDFSKYEMWGPNSEKDTRDYIELMIKNSQMQPRYKFEMAVVLNDEQLIGGCGLRRASEESLIADMGWAINPRFQGQGYATEAAKCLIDFARRDLGVKVVFATCDIRNAASYKVMEKLGMKRVGFIKGHMKVKGHVRDSYRYELAL